MRRWIAKGGFIDVGGRRRQPGLSRTSRQQSARGRQNAPKRPNSHDIAHSGSVAARPIEQNHGAQAGGGRQMRPAAPRPRLLPAPGNSRRWRRSKGRMQPSSAEAAALLAIIRGVRPAKTQNTITTAPRPKVIDAADPRMIPIKTVNGRISSGSYTLACRHRLL